MTQRLCDKERKEDLSLKGTIVSFDGARGEGFIAPDDDEDQEVYFRQDFVRIRGRPVQARTLTNRWDGINYTYVVCST